MSGQKFSSSKENRYWSAATVHNGVLEHRAFATLNNNQFLPAPSKLNILISSYVSIGTGSTPLFGIRYKTAIVPTYVRFHLTGNWLSQAAEGLVSEVLSKLPVDISFGTSENNVSRFDTDWFDETIFHELSHASHYSKAGASLYGQFVQAVINEVVNNVGSVYSPYGNGTSSNSAIIALGEGWAYHMGYYLAHAKFNSSGTFPPSFNTVNGDENRSLQDIIDLVTTPQNDLKVLENFRPFYPNDAFSWIPKGLMLDLIDNSELNRTFSEVTDGVTGFTIAQLYGALQSDVTSVPAYRTRLKQQNPTVSTAAAVDALFAQYHY